MLDEVTQQQESLLTQVEALAAERVAARERDLFRGFLRYYYEMASPDSLRLRAPEDLLEIALGHWSLARARAEDEVKVSVRPPRDPAAHGSRGFAIVETVTDDMPFLVDTVAMAVRAAGVSIDWTVHPVLRLRRSPKDAVQDVLGAAGVARGGHPESLIHVECEPLPKPEDYAALEQAIRDVLTDLRTVVVDYPAMRARLAETVAKLQVVPPGAAREDFEEAQEFLRWLDEHHFTFLGYSEMRSEQDRLVPVPQAGLGLLRAGGRFANTEEFLAPQEELNKYATSTRLVVITKANSRSPIHHPEYMDSVSVKHYREDGALIGTRRFVGLFSAEAYSERPRDIPLIRKKAEHVMQRSRLPEHSHSGKNLREILHTLPRDELFQSNEEELFHVCTGIRALRDRQQLRLFMRRDRYGRFYSCMVYLPRDRYSRELRDRIEQELKAVCNGTSVDRNIEFLRGALARIHYLVRTPPGTRIAQSTAEVEQRLLVATRSWRDQLREALVKAGAEGARIAANFVDAFPLSYAELNTPAEAAMDVQHLVRLAPHQPVLPRLMAESAAGAGVCPTSLKLYAWKSPIALSDVLPTLENFGLRVVRQEPTEVQPRGAETLWIQEFEIRVSGACELAPAEQKSYFEAAFLKTWCGETENDGLNRLVLAAGLDWRQVTCLRVMLKYLLQTGLPYSQSYMTEQLAAHAHIARLLVKLFETRFDPNIQTARRRDEELKLAQELDAGLDQVATLDADRVLRGFLSFVRAALRTNYFQPAAGGGIKPYVSVKLNPKLLPELPAPLPMFEVFVYSPEVEGIHLRGGKVARGGLRWSDRKQDFRTEVLGLMKAQTVKNAVIVPVGAKGGFVVKKPVDPADREAWLKQGIECYKTFLRSLLDITDNRVGDAVVTPQNIVRDDDDDPYLVVAADKGTASFSDIANGVSADYGFWLGDAFASGGSAGYDHKKMGITARGAWESVKRHFRELNKDIQNEEFTCVGIGDMSGDVFGNGMLLSRKTKLIAAFDHRHIFLDPDPDPEKSFDERKRLFELPRSSWSDYNPDLISKGGGVYPRSAKNIKLSPEARRALDLGAERITPNDLIRAILTAPVELLWNGGIGTYVKASHQSHLEAGDRTNDGVRVNGRQLRCKVVGEGGNLGFTQSGRIEFALRGGALHDGRINTDSIDNSGGVHTSDREVNIKIPLNRLMAEGKLTRVQRNPLLGAMQDDIARFVLTDNYVQSAAISIAEQHAAMRLDEHANLIRTLERDGLLARAVEYLPDDETLTERRTRGRGLTRPEIAILLSYAKISLFDALLSSDVPDDPFFERDLLADFPKPMVEKFREPLIRHRLRREIIATILSNAVVNRMGIAFAHRFAEDHGTLRAEVVKAYAVAHEIYDGNRYWLAIQALDNRVPAALQYRLFDRAIGLLKHGTTWLLNNKYSVKPIGETVERLRKPVGEVEALLPDCLPPSYRADWDRAVAAAEKDGVPRELAARLANTRVLGSAPDIVELSLSVNVPLSEAAGAYFGIGERLRVLWLLSSIIGLQVQGKWQALARSNLREDTYRLHRQLAARVLQFEGQTPEARIEAWTRANETKVRFGIRRLEELQAGGVQDFMTLAVGVREMRKLRML